MRAAIGLVLALGGGVGRAVGQRLQRIGDVHHAAVERQLGAEQVQLLEIDSAARAGSACASVCARHVGGDDRVAVAVAADPAAHAQERTQCQPVEAEPVLEVGVEFAAARARKVWS